MEKRAKDITCPHCGWIVDALPESALHLPPGTILQEKYLIGKALGQGGFGITYLAWDKTLNIKLAIKEYMPQELAYRTGGQGEVSLFKSSLADSFIYGLEKFLEEARTLAQFNEHPNIVSVRDFFKVNGTAYLVMSYIEGLTLKEYLSSMDKPLTFEQAFNIFMPVLDALKDVHAAGLLHRDISPDNLVIDAQGRIVLIDFGAARRAMGDKSRTMSIIMKAGYSPIEQYQSKGKQGPWTDIYAVAATMYHSLTGIIMPDSLNRLTEDTIAPPSQLGVKIKPYQEEAILKALEVRATNRFQSVEEFQENLNKTTGKLIDKKQSLTEEFINKDASKDGVQEPAIVFKRDLTLDEEVPEQIPDLKPAQEAVKAEPIVNESANESKSVEKKNSYASIYYICGILLFIGLLMFMINLGSNQYTIRYDGGIYEGDLLNFIPHGTGTWVHASGYDYSGEYKDGEKHGYGKYTWPDGSQYEGEWKDDKRHGEGTMTWGAGSERAGSKYVGEFKDNEMYGQGTYSSSEGFKYTGKHKDGSPHGYGTFNYSNGDQYVGEFKEGTRHGQGTYTYADGTVLDGVWENGEYIGPNN